MITNSLKITIEKNLFIRNSILNLNKDYARKISNTIPEISAISIAFNRNLNQEIDWEKISKEIAIKIENQFLAKLGEYNLYFFKIQNLWQQETKIINYKKFWKLEENKSLINLFCIQTSNLPQEIKIKKGDYIRYGTCFKVLNDNFPNAINLIRLPSSNMIMLLTDHYNFSHDEIKYILEILTKKDDLDFSEYMTYLCLKLNLNRYVFFRVSGAFDDTDFAIDFIYQERQDEYIKKIISQELKS